LVTAPPGLGSHQVAGCGPDNELAHEVQALPNVVCTRPPPARVFGWRWSLKRPVYVIPPPRQSASPERAPPASYRPGSRRGREVGSYATMESASQRPAGRVDVLKEGGTQSGGVPEI